MTGDTLTAFAPWTSACAARLSKPSTIDRIPGDALEARKPHGPRGRSCAPPTTISSTVSIRNMGEGEARPVLRSVCSRPPSSSSAQPSASASARARGESEACCICAPLAARRTKLASDPIGPGMPPPTGGPALLPPCQEVEGLRPWRRAPSKTRRRRGCMRLRACCPSSPDLRSDELGPKGHGAWRQARSSPRPEQEDPREGLRVRVGQAAFGRPPVRPNCVS